MCGRARCTLSPVQAARAFGFLPTSADAGGGDGPAVPTLYLDRFCPSYNVSPGAYLPVGRLEGGGDGGGGADGKKPVIQFMKWGLVPSFTSKTQKPDHFRMFNARSETVKEKVSYLRLIPKNRCLVAVEGFYEWKKDVSKKQPFYIHFQDHRPLVFAALYDTWTNSDGEMIHTFTILTTRASTSLNWLHDRMPVILGNKKSVNAWLTDASVKLEEITAPYEGSDLIWHPVTSALGKTSFDGPECIKEVHMGPTEKPILSFFKKSTVYNQSGKPEMSQELAETHATSTAKVEYDDSVENQPKGVNQQPRERQTPSTVNDEKPQIFEKPWSIKDEDSITLTDANIIKQDNFGIKRKIKDTGVKADLKMENSGWSPSPRKKEKCGKGASNRQASLFSFFARK